MLRGPFQGFLAETIGLRPLYLIAVISTAFSFLIFLRFFPDSKGKDKVFETEKQSGKKILKLEATNKSSFRKPKLS